MRNVEWWWHCQLFLHVILFSIQLCQTALNCIRINDTFKWNRRNGIHTQIHIQFSFVARTEGSKRNFRSLIKKCKWNYDLVWLWLFVWSLCHDFFFAFCVFFFSIFIKGFRSNFLRNINCSIDLLANVHTQWYYSRKNQTEVTVFHYKKRHLQFKSCSFTDDVKQTFIAFYLMKRRCLIAS